jgi:subtilase family serine protease
LSLKKGKSMRNFKFAKISLSVLALMALAACGGGSGSTSSTDDAGPNLKAAARIDEAVRQTETTLDASAPIHVVVALNLNDRAGLDTFVEQLRTPGSPNYQKPLSSAELTQRYGPTQQQVSAVQSFLQKNGFTNITVASNNIFVEADAPASAVSTAFHTTLARYKLATGEMAHANTSGVTIPNELAGIVKDVLGLDTVTRAHLHIVAAKANIAATTATASEAAHNPTQFPAIYNVGSTPNGAKTTVGIIAAGALTPTIYASNTLTAVSTSTCSTNPSTANVPNVACDLASYESQNGLASVPVYVDYMPINSYIDTPCTLSGGAYPASCTAGTVEWDLDSQSIVAMSGGVKQINFYVASSMANSDLATAINAAVTANTAQVVNMSFGGCAESNYADTSLELAVAQGQTFVASSGDTGSVAAGYVSNNGTVTNVGCTGTSLNYPASSPYVVSVGGTSLTTNGNTTYVSETAWAGSGGGYANGTLAGTVSEPIPTWQATVPSLSGTQYRGVPDIAFDADPASGALITVNGQPNQQYGGTSLAAPLFSATWARLISACGNLGFAAPVLYDNINQHSTIVQDITTGNNHYVPYPNLVTGSPAYYNAGTGWDAVTGLGTPNISNLWGAVCPAGSAYNTEVEQLFLAYLGRPPAPAGLASYSTALQTANAPTNILNLQSAYSTNASVASIVNGIESSAESKALYPTTNTSAYVTALFNTMLNRAPLSAGLNYYVTAVGNGTITQGDLALAIYVGTLTSNGTTTIDDNLTLVNKTAVAGNFTATLTPSELPYYSGTTALGKARKLLQTVSYANNGPAAVISLGGVDYFLPQGAYVSSFEPTINSTISSIVAGN